MLTLAECESLATGRTASLFQDDVDANRAALSASLLGRSVLVIGAAGSIGCAVVKNILAFRPGALVLIDLSENNLAELVRDLRSSPHITLPQRFAALPIGLGNVECRRFLAEAEPFDYLFNLSALKHVRSEKDVFSLMRMIDTNVLFLDELLASLPAEQTKVFSVSTDKAANPMSVMGASKRLMELVLVGHSLRTAFSTARFANVAFSDGSLPFAFLRRVEKQQPIAAPSDIRRFFMSHDEAGQLCLLSGVLGSNREGFLPKLESGIHERTFREIAVGLLQRLGYEPYECASEEEAKATAARLIGQKKWPCLFLPSDTSGEKPREEFYCETENIDWKRFKSVGVIRYPSPAAEQAAVRGFIEFAKAARRRSASKSEYLAAFRDALPDFHHIERQRDLDQKM